MKKLLTKRPLIFTAAGALVGLGIFFVYLGLGST